MHEHILKWICTVSVWNNPWNYQEFYTITENISSNFVKSLMTNSHLNIVKELILKMYLP